jgi:hypothetical protein
MLVRYRHAIFLLTTLLVFAAGAASPLYSQKKLSIDIAALERSRVLLAAEAFLNERPVTVTAYRSPRSAGGIHEYFSEGDYWWPDSADPSGPYVRHDGLTNPDNFDKHREVMRRFSHIVSALTAAYKVTHREEFAAHAIRHLKAWFVDDSTKMYPHLKYAQAIKGVATGRGTGIIDTIHLVEIAKAVEVLHGSPSLSGEDEAAIKNWIAEYLKWLTTHKYGIDERESRNNHGTWWVTQVAAFAHAVNDTATMSFCRMRYKTVLLPNQMAPNGSFPEELRRTKPYNYSLFSLDGMAIICWILSTPADNLWQFTLPDGRSIRKGMEFLFPYIVDKSKWPYPKDVMHFDSYPGRHPSFLFAGIALGEQQYLDAWRKLPSDSPDEEVQRNTPLCQPVLWIDR